MPVPVARKTYEFSFAEEDLTILTDQAKTANRKRKAVFCFDITQLLLS